MTYIYDAVRTPRGKGKEGGALASLGADELVAALVDSLKSRLKQELQPDALIVGAVGQVGSQGGNIGLVSKFRAGLPDDTSAYAVNNLCVSGLTAIHQASAMVSSGQADSVLAGGVEMMSSVAFMADKADFYTDTTLPLRSRYLLVALAADRLAEDQGISREELDKAALVSQLAAKVGGAAKYYKDVLGRDVDHRHTVAHAPPISDGAGLALIGSKDAFDVAPRAKIIASAEVGGDYKPSPEKVNVGGGHLAKGHPLGASGAILLSALMDALDASNGRYGIVVAAGASGTGSAMVIERLS